MTANPLAAIPRLWLQIVHSRAAPQPEVEFVAAPMARSVVDGLRHGTSTDCRRRAKLPAPLSVGVLVISFPLHTAPLATIAVSMRLHRGIH